MRITGETNDGRIGEKVMDILVTLPYDPEQDTLFFVAVDQHGIIDIEEKYRSIEWAIARQAIIFLFREDNCSIRHVDENYNIHKQYIGRKGYRICVNDCDSLDLCLYQNGNLLDLRMLNRENFQQEVKGMWADYHELIKR